MFHAEHFAGATCSGRGHPAAAAGCRCQSLPNYVLTFGCCARLQTFFYFMSCRTGRQGGRCDLQRIVLWCCFYFWLTARMMVLFYLFVLPDGHTFCLCKKVSKSTHKRAIRPLCIPAMWLEGSPHEPPKVLFF